jgi:thiol-disulfide isomerase/thioredoxin
MRNSLVLAVACWWTLFAVPTFAQEATEAAAPQANDATTSAETDSEKEATAEDAEAFDEIKFANDFQALLREGKFEEAETQLNEAIEKHPDATRLPSLHGTAYSYLVRANRREDALRHMAAFIDHQMKIAARDDRFTEQFSRLLGMLIDETTRTSGAERAAEIVDDFAKRAASLDPPAPRIAAAVETRRVLNLIQSNKVDEARSRVDERLKAAEEALAQAPNDATLILSKAAALKDRIQLESAVEGGDPTAAWTAFSEFLSTQAKEHPELSALKQQFVQQHLERAMELASSDPDAAEAVLARIDSLSTETPDDDDDDPEAAAQAQQLAQQVAYVRKEIADQRRLLAIIGMPAALPENADGWVNGEPLTRESLKGKVVLLDFFAVWCGPCIATFPHLRQWHDDYSDKGLQIIGITSYYNYDWNAEAERPERSAEIEPEAERAAMEQFIKHHELRHPVAYVTDRQLQEFYVVSGIPHAVLIDRQGNVRLFRIGSGEANAADLEKAIKECLDEPAPEA